MKKLIEYVKQWWFFKKLELEEKSRIATIKQQLDYYKHHENFNESGYSRWTKQHTDRLGND